MAGNCFISSQTTFLSRLNSRKFAQWLSLPSRASPIAKERSESVPRSKPAAEHCSAALIFATGPTLLGYLLILVVVFAIFGIRDLFQDLSGEKRREHKEALKTAIEQLKEDHEPLTAENIQEQKDANAKPSLIVTAQAISETVVLAATLHRECGPVIPQ